MAKHLIRQYGTASLRVVEIGKTRGLTGRLHPDYPFTESEVLYSVHSEMAVKPNDVVCRRVPISFIDEQAARDVILPKVVDIMATEFNWTQERKESEMQEALQGLASMK